jgi:hypothetical protein
MESGGSALMPVFEITAPDGRKFRVTAPEGATREQALAKVKAQYAAPNKAAAATSLVDQIPGNAQSPSVAAPAIGALESLDAAATLGTGAIGGGLGFIGGALKGIFDSVASGEFGSDEGVKRAEQEAMRWAEKLTRAPKTAGGAELVEGIGGFLQEHVPAALPVAAPEMAAIGSATRSAGGAARAMTSKSTAGVRNALESRWKAAANAPGLRIFAEDNTVTPEAMDRLGAAVQSGKVTPEQAQTVIRETQAAGVVFTPEMLERYNRFVRRGVDPMLADITRNTEDSVQQQSAMKYGGEVAETAARQEAQIAGVVERGIEGIAPLTTNIEDTNASVFSTISNRLSKSDEAMAEAYKAADKVAGKQFRVKPERFLKAIQDARGPELNNPVVTHAIKILQNRGALKNDATIDKTKGSPRVNSDQLKDITVREAEAIRQELNQIWDSTSPQGRRVIRDLKDAIDDDVNWYAPDKDIFKAARETKIAERRMIERARRDKRDQSSGSFLEDVISNAVPENQIVQTLVSGRRKDDLLHVRRFMLEDAGPEGRQTWDNVRAQPLRDALEKAVGTMGRREGGQPVFNVRTFDNAMKGLRNKGYFNVLFTPEERALIDDVIAIGKDRIPISGTAQGYGPTERAVFKAAKDTLRRLPVIGEAAIGYLEDAAATKAAKRITDVRGEIEKSAALR